MSDARNFLNEIYRIEQDKNTANYITIEKALCAVLGCSWTPTGISIKSLLANLPTHIAQCVADEREACAQIADSPDDWSPATIRIASAIRARETATERKTATEVEKLVHSLHSRIPHDSSISVKSTTQTSPADDGWIAWHGGSCPVPADTLVEYRMRSGYWKDQVKAGVLRWTCTPIPNSADIIAYRVVSALANAGTTPVRGPAFGLKDCSAYHSQGYHGACSNCGAAWKFHPIAQTYFEQEREAWRDVPITAGLIADAYAELHLPGNDDRLSTIIERLARLFVA